ncbi:autotransporter outer membrane beta-barrel domain-containing protein [Piscirickettsia litoralis]|uniref:Autotransporter domain-containing protein n=1 Tax=Piscirickettsia litoralis TaxID=1891921 RepID=A0ABX3A394_9GAMM|nr:hypothetical protein [Piscirickettsia litoralis]ODN43347.1 hypothetical protein BGC07_10940 [Piscirickettsia litoralis]
MLKNTTQGGAAGDGENGVSLGVNGGDGGNFNNQHNSNHAVHLFTDIANTNTTLNILASATGGRGGNGGNASCSIFSCGDGGHGGNGEEAISITPLNNGNTTVVLNTEILSAVVTGGAGGQGGTGVTSGNGGHGGEAIFITNDGIASDGFSSSLTATANIRSSVVGGQGGAGVTAGNGGAGINIVDGTSGTNNTTLNIGYKDDSNTTSTDHLVTIKGGQAGGSSGTAGVGIVADIDNAGSSLTLNIAASGVIEGTSSSSTGAKIGTAIDASASTQSMTMKGGGKILGNILLPNNTSDTDRNDITISNAVSGYIIGDGNNDYTLLDGTFSPEDTFYGIQDTKNGELDTLTVGNGTTSQFTSACDIHNTACNNKAGFPTLHEVDTITIKDKANFVSYGAISQEGGVRGTMTLESQGTASLLELNLGSQMTLKNVLTGSTLDDSGNVNTDGYTRIDADITVNGNSGIVFEVAPGINRVPGLRLYSDTMGSLTLNQYGVVKLAIGFSQIDQRNRTIQGAYNSAADSVFFYSV